MSEIDTEGFSNEEIGASTDGISKNEIIYEQNKIASQEGTMSEDIAKQDQTESIKNSTETIKKIANSNKINTEPNLESDLTNLSEEVNELAGNTNSDVGNLKQLDDWSKNNLSESTKNILQTLTTKFNSAFSDLISKAFSKFDANSTEEFKNNVNETKTAGQKLIDSINENKSDGEIQNNFDELKNSAEKVNENLENNEKLKENMIAKNGESGWEQFKTIVKYLSILGGLTGLFVFIYLYVKEHTGCYIVQGGKSSKLQGCDGWYKNNKFSCQCTSSIVDPKNSMDPDCSKLNNEDCCAPYCLGQSCGSNTCAEGASDQKNSCVFPQGHRFQCTSGSLTDSGSVYYYYKQVSPLDAIASIPKYAGDITKDLASDMSYLIWTIFKWILFAIAIIIISMILVAIIKKWIKKSNENSEY